MANVQVFQRHAHLASAVKLEFVNGREGKVAKAVLTAISNSRRGSGETREEESTAIQWTLWGKQAENAAEYLGKGSHVNIVGRVRNNNYRDNEGNDVYTLAFTAEEVDYLDSRADSEARRATAPDEQNRSVSPCGHIRRHPPAPQGPWRSDVGTDHRLKPAGGAGAAYRVPSHPVISSLRSDKATGMLTLRSGPVENLKIPEMSMMFAVIDRNMLEIVRKGDLVLFTADLVGGKIAVTHLEVIKQSAPPWRDHTASRGWLSSIVSCLRTSAGA